MNPARRIVLTALLGALPIALQAHGTVSHAPYTSALEAYDVPDTVLTNQDGEKVQLREVLGDDRPVLVQFIFATCTTVCPVLSSTYRDLQRQLGDRAGEVRLVSITIDPEHDTPKVMKAYLAKYQAMPGWEFLTGQRPQIGQVVRAFAANSKTKMDHAPLTFIHVPREGKWVRLTGLMSGKELMAECQKAGLTF